MIATAKYQYKIGNQRYEWLYFFDDYPYPPPFKILLSVYPKMRFSFGFKIKGDKR